MNAILQKRIEEAAKKYCQDKNYILPDDTELSLEALTAIDAYIEAAKSILQNQWISVEEALPEFQQSVVVTNSEGDYWTSWRSNDNCEHKDNNGFVNYGIGEITHWAEIQKFNK